MGNEKIIHFELKNKRIELQFALLAARRARCEASKQINNGYLAWLIGSLGGLGGVW